jgi:hypothetical protein
VKSARREAKPTEKGLYKASGQKIKNPSAYVANFESRGQSEPLFNALGDEIKNPVAYVAKMMENESRTGKVLVPLTRGSQVTYYSKLGKQSRPSRKEGGGRSLGDRLRSALTNGMRARAVAVKEEPDELGGTRRRPARR